MAKEIKAIQCPKCGSPQKAEVRPDVYRCDSCGTEYYLDNDDVNVNYNVRHHAPPALPAPASQSRVLVGVIAVVALLLVSGLRYLVRPAPLPVYPQVVMGPSVGTGGPEPVDRSHFSWGSVESVYYLTPARRPGLFVAGTRSYGSSTGPDSSYVAFLDATTGAELRSMVLPVAPSRSSPDFDLKPLSNGDLYLILDKATVFRVNPAAQTVTDVTKGWGKDQPELASGVATVEGADEEKGDGFNVFTNDGRNVNYYPLIRRVYTKDSFYDAQHGFKSLRPGSPLKTGFVFSSKSTEYPEDKMQLLKYQYRDNGGGPKSVPQFEWSDDYGGSGMFTDADPHRKVLTTPHELENDRVLSYSDFTPGRLYFEPGVLCADGEYALLTFRPTAAPNSPTVVQCLNARTGAIVFTRPLPGAEGLRRGLRHPAGFVVGDDRHTYVIGQDGSLLNHVEIK